MYVYMHVCMYVCMHACMYVCIYACMYVCMYVSTHVYVHNTYNLFSIYIMYEVFCPFSWDSLIKNYLVMKLDILIIPLVTG